MNEDMFLVFVIVGVAVKVILFLAQIGSKNSHKSAVKNRNMSELDLIRQLNSGRGNAHHIGSSFGNDCASDGVGFMNQMMQQQNDEFNRQFMDWSMEESRKTVTPFDMGGYDSNPCNNFSMGSSFGSPFDMGGGFGMF